MGDSCAEEARENLEETLDVKVKMGWWSNGFKEGAHAQIFILGRQHLHNDSRQVP